MPYVTCAVNRLVKRKSKWMTFIFTHELSLTLASVLGPFCMHFAAGSGRNMRKVRGNILQTHFLMHMSRVGSHISWCICNVALLWISKKKKKKKKKKRLYLAVFQLMRKVRGGEIFCKHISWCTCHVWDQSTCQKKVKMDDFHFYSRAFFDPRFRAGSILHAFCGGVWPEYA